MHSATEASPRTDFERYNEALSSFVESHRKPTIREKVRADLEKISNLYETYNFRFRLAIERVCASDPSRNRTFYFNAKEQSCDGKRITVTFEPHENNFAYRGAFGCKTKMKLILEVNGRKQVEGTEKESNEGEPNNTKIKVLSHVIMVNNYVAMRTINILTNCTIESSIISEENYQHLRKELNANHDEIYVQLPRITTATSLPGTEQKDVDQRLQSNTFLPSFHTSIQEVQKVIFSNSLGSINTALNVCEKNSQKKISAFDRQFEAMLVADSLRFSTMTPEEIESYRRRSTQN